MCCRDKCQDKFGHDGMMKYIYVMTLRVQSDVRIKLNCDMPRKNEVIKDLQSQLEEAHGQVGMGNLLFPGLRAR